ncbi:MAG: IS481 family transposase [Candidatus Gastranaerophilaceae bacterium]|jgi:transposase InsO family protein|nr:IS481 family transposase [Christensenellales bacterium]
MPWEEKTVAQMREEFINMVQQGNYSMTEICRQFGVSRKTGYKWLERYKAGEGLEDKSRAPLHQANKTSRETELLILSLREEHPAWGPRKLKRRLADLGYSGLPAVSTVAEILRRNGQISEQESRKHRPIKRFEKEQANELWQMDFKGQFPLMDGSQCFPLTLLDDHSRFSLCLDAKAGQKGADVSDSLVRLFHTYGLPNAILCDNGKPWGGNRQGISSMDVWFMQLGILPIHIRPHHPQTQGKEERFHLTLDKELLQRCTFDNQRQAQRHFDW